MSSGASKPYLNLKQSLIQFFSAPTRYLKESIQKESVFEKPYWDGEYPSMHLDIPAADWPSWSFEDDLRIRRRRKHPSGGGGFVPTPRCPGCALYADASYDCTNDPVEIHSGIFCTNTPGAATNKILTAKQKQYELSTSGWDITGKTVGVPYGVQAGDTVLEIYAQVGSIKQITIGQWAFIGPSAAVWVDPNIAEHTICGRMIDGAGSVCYACVDVSCCDCANPPSVFQVSTYDTTISRNGSAYVTVSGGCGPYSWSVSGGVGFSVLSATTQTTTGGISASGVACGTATVTITDRCSTSVTAQIRCAQGSDWYEKSTGVCQISGSGTPSYLGAGGGCADRITYLLTVGVGRQYQYVCMFYSESPSDCASLTEEHAERCVCGNANCGCWGLDWKCTACIEDVSEYPICICHEAGITVRCQCTKELTYSEWECTP